MCNSVILVKSIWCTALLQELWSGANNSRVMAGGDGWGFKVVEPFCGGLGFGAFSFGAGGGNAGALCGGAFGFGTPVWCW